MPDVETLSAIVVDHALRIHRALGPGLLESVYEVVLAASIQRDGIPVERQKSVSFSFEGLDFPDAFRIDLLIDGQLIVEVKSVEMLSKAHAKQLLTYVRLTHQPVGLLINFGGATLKEGLKRIVNDHQNVASSRLRVNQQGDRWDSFNRNNPSLENLPSAETNP